MISTVAWLLGGWLLLQGLLCGLGRFTRWSVLQRQSIFWLVAFSLQGAGMLWWYVCHTMQLQGVTFFSAWGGVGLVLLGVALGYTTTRWAGSMRNKSLFFALLPAMMTAMLAEHFGYFGRTAVTFTVLLWLVLPGLWWLSCYFGSSLGYLVSGLGRSALHWGYEGWLGRRFLLAKGSRIFATVTLIAMVGVSVGVFLVLFALGVLSGFEHDLRDKIIGANAHVVVKSNDQPFLQDSNPLDSTISAVPGVQAMSPYLETEVGFASASNDSVGLLVGIDPTGAPKVLQVLHHMQDGSVQQLQRNSHIKKEPRENTQDFAVPGELPGIILGSALATELNVTVGESVRVISALATVLTPIGPQPRTMAFELVGIFNSKMYDYDSRYAYTSLSAARRFLRLGAHQISGLHISTETAETSTAVVQGIKKQLGPRAKGLEITDWKHRNETLFAALDLERMVSFIVLAFIILVASFAIVNTLTLSILEKRQQIAVLKTLGASTASVMKAFVVQGLLVGVVGTIFGMIGGVGALWLLKHFGLGIPSDVYYIDSLPVQLEFSDIALVLVCALAIVWNFSVFPSVRGAELKPVEGLRES